MSAGAITLDSIFDAYASILRQGATPKVMFMHPKEAAALGIVLTPPPLPCEAFDAPYDFPSQY